MEEMATVDGNVDENESDVDGSSVHQLVFLLSVHAPLIKRYDMVSGDFVTIGEKGEYGRVDPESGAEYRALGGTDHRYNKDYKIGSSYPKTLFVYGSDGKGNMVSHEALEARLRDNGEWSDGFHRIRMPKGSEGGELTWYNGFQMKPPERAPYSVDVVATRLKKKFDEDNVLHFGGNTVEVFFPDCE